MLKQNKPEGIKDEIDLMELFFEMLDHWKMILLSTILVGAIAYTYAKYFITPQYSSTSMLYVLSKSTSITSLSDIQLGTNLTNDYIVVVNGRPIVDQVIENLGLNESYGSLAGRISLSNPSNSRILKITVTDASPTRAKQIADELAEVASAFISEKMDQDPPTIIQYGYADGGPVSPNVRRYTMRGAIVGAFLAIAVIVIIYLLNDTIMNRDDVERRLGLNYLGMLPLEEDNEETDNAKERKHRDRKKGKAHEDSNAT
jgi:capsular polysaccharide biosynthesis protein